MAEAIVSHAWQTLSNMLVQEATLLSGVADQVEEVRVELKQMLCFLKDADSKRCKDEISRNYLREIRSLAYRMEDIVETFAIEVAARESSGERGIEKFIKCLAGIEEFIKCLAGIFGEIRSRHQLGTEIEKVKSRINSINTSFSKFNVKAVGGEKVGSSNDDQQFQQWSRQTYPDEAEEYFVGMEDDITNLVYLVTDHDNLRRVSIWGMGGLGKTTLARKVYKHRDVQRCFERFAWTCVTQEAHIEGILQDLLMQLLPERKNDVKAMEGRELVRQLQQVQIKRKCLVVLDDIWKVKDWKSIRAAFHVAEGVSKVLLTTRDKEVAKIGFPYDLKCLNEKESWELLQRIAFSNRGTGFEISPDLEDLGMKMVSKCGGLPLAISVLGGILKDKETLTDWMNVNTCIGSYLSKIEDDGEADGGSVARVLSLSYNELPYHLKFCFLYLGIFKEDEDIEPDHLYQLWMAESLVLPQHRITPGETLMEVAGRYLHELGRRSMVQLQWDEYSSTKRIVSCRLHDMMRDLCLEKGREEEFVNVMDSQEVKQPLLESSSLSDSATYRLVIRTEEVNAAPRILSVHDNSLQIRSLFCLKRNYWGKRVWPQGIVMKNFKMLRTLKFEGFNFEGKTLPLELRNLIHLRILSLQWCKLDELPSSVAELPLLQTLDLEYTSGIKIPDILWKMKRLKHLYFGMSLRTKGGKLRLHGLSELEILWGFDGERDEIEDLLELENLRMIYASVSNNDNLHALISCLNKNGPKLQEIQLDIGGGCDFITSEKKGYELLEMVLMCGRIRQLYFNATLVEFPNYEPHFLQGLAKLNLLGNKMEEDPMETLGQLPNLRRLLLGYNSFMGEYMICHELSFPQLRYLCFRELEKLKYWRVDEGCMPNLSRLWIRECESLAMIPYGLRFVSGIKELTIDYMPIEFGNRVRVVDGQEGADYYKIQHVPSIRVIERRY